MLNDCRARVLIADGRLARVWADSVANAPHLTHVLVMGPASDTPTDLKGTATLHSFDDMLATASPAPVRTATASRTGSRAPTAGPPIRLGASTAPGQIHVAVDTGSSAARTDSVLVLTMAAAPALAPQAALSSVTLAPTPSPVVVSGATTAARSDLVVGGLGTGVQLVIAALVPPGAAAADPATLSLAWLPMAAPTPDPTIVPFQAVRAQ